jgi:hypothetical protein
VTACATGGGAVRQFRHGNNEASNEVYKGAKMGSYVHKLNNQVHGRSMDVDEPGASPRLPPEPYHSPAEAPLGSPGTEITRCTVTVYKRAKMERSYVHKLNNQAHG